MFKTFQSWLRTSSNDEKKIQNVNVFIISSINSIFGTGKFPSYSWTVARKYHRNELTFHMFLHAKREDIRPHLDWNVKIAASFLLASEISFPPIECWWEEKNVPQFTLIKFRNWIAFDLECWLLFFHHWYLMRHGRCFCSGSIYKIRNVWKLIGILVCGYIFGWIYSFSRYFCSFHRDETKSHLIKRCRKIRMRTAWKLW